MEEERLKKLKIENEKEKRRREEQKRNVKKNFKSKIFFNLFFLFRSISTMNS
jgi:hypothetical protein